MVESESGAFFTILLLLVGRVWGYFWSPCDFPCRIRPTLNAFWYCELHENETLLNLESCDIDHYVTENPTPNQHKLTILELIWQSKTNSKALNILLSSQ